MKLGFICPNLPGHLNPMTALARHLQARNHEVVFLYSTEGNGLPFVPGPEKDHIKENRTEQSIADLKHWRDFVWSENESDRDSQESHDPGRSKG